MTDADGLFRTGWVRKLGRGDYSAEVTDLAMAQYQQYYWDHSLDQGEDLDGDGLPDDVLHR